jgi:hypothetical protein
MSGTDFHPEIPTQLKEEPHMYHEINEGTARRAHEANSFREFKQGRATLEYRAAIDEARTIADAQKERTDEIHHDKIEGLFAAYCRKLAGNMNHRNEIEARVPSVMIAGGSNFPTGKKMKQNEARDRNHNEWQEIQGLLDKIRSVGMGGISADDPNAAIKLKEKLSRLEAEHAYMKAANAHCANISR